MGNRVYADYEFLRGKHPEYFEDVEHARAAVEFVLDDPVPCGVVNGNPSFLRKEETDGTVWRIEIRDNGTKQNHVRSVHRISEKKYQEIRAGRSDTPKSVRPDRSTASGNRPKVDIASPEARRFADFLRYNINASSENVKLDQQHRGATTFNDAWGKRDSFEVVWEKSSLSPVMEQVLPTEESSGNTPLLFCGQS